MSVPKPELGNAYGRIKTTAIGTWITRALHHFALSAEYTAVEILPTSA